MRIIQPLIFFAVATLPLVVCGQSTVQAEEPTPAPCTTEPYGQFDFWLGRWTVHSTEGQLQGNNTITKQEGGCLVLERWQSAAGGTGQSYNFYNPSTNLWRQLWISEGTIIDYSGGLDPSGAMTLKGKITYHANQLVADFRGTWTPQADGSVVQFFEQYDDEKKTWETWFKGIYTREVPEPDMRN